MYGGNCRTSAGKPSTFGTGPSCDLNRSSHQTSTIRKWFYIIFCLIFLVSGIGLATPQAVHATGSDYLLDRVITWGDGTTEHIQIGRDAFFYLDGQKKHLVGMEVSGINPNIANYWEFWRPDSLALLDKQLAYFQSKGIRLARVRIIPIMNSVKSTAQEKEAYTAYLDLFYKHKILVIMNVDARLLPHFDGFDPVDFVMWQTDTVSQWAARLATIANGYSNVVAACADNELDNKAGVGQKYTTQQATEYLTLLTNVLRQNMDAVVTTTFMANNIEPGIKQAGLKLVDVPSLNNYFESPEIMKTNLNSLLPWMSIRGGWWCMELGSWTKDGPNSDQVNAAYIDAAFDSGATIAMLFLTTDVPHPQYAYFNNDGTPKPFMVAIAGEVSRLQAPVSDGTMDSQVIARR